MDTRDIIGTKVAVTDYKKAVEWIEKHARKADQAYAIEAANTHVLALARHDKQFAKVMAAFDLICPDGMPLVWAVNKFLPHEQKLQDRVYGPCLMLESLNASQNQEDLGHFLLGGAQTTLDKLVSRFHKDYPATNIVGAYSPLLVSGQKVNFRKYAQ